MSARMQAALIILGLFTFFAVASGGALLWSWLLSRIPPDDYPPYD